MNRVNRRDRGQDIEQLDTGCVSHKSIFAFIHYSCDIIASPNFSVSRDGTTISSGVTEISFQKYQPCLWRQHGSPKRLYPTTTLQGATTRTYGTTKSPIQVVQ
jgi:hypothetical protein